MTAEPSLDELRNLMSLVESRSGEPARGPVAIVVIDPDQHARACA
jgi:hypothetical protein